MKLLCSVLFSCMVFTASAQSNMDVLHYKFSIELNDNNDTIQGMAQIVVFVKKGTRNLTFDLTGDTDNKKGMEAWGIIVTYPGIDKTKITDPAVLDAHVLPNDFIHKNDRLVVKLWRALTNDDTLTATIYYKGKPSNGLIISKNRFGKRTFFSDNWPNRAHDWLPCVDDPADKASVEFIVTAPSNYQVVSNGVLAEETDLPDNKKLTHWKEDVPVPTKVMVIGVAEFAVQYTGFVNNCISVSSWVYPENKAEGYYDYAIAKDVLAWHINYIGPYAYKKLANVQAKTMFGGMENAGAIFYAEELVNGNGSLEDLISHEIVHQWFGNSATEKSFAHLWLSEGFATYLTHVYIESKYGTDSLNNRMAADRETVLDFVRYTRRPVIDSTTAYMSLLNANSYQKGSWVLHMLRRQLGDAIFHKSIRDYYASYAGKNADTKDLQKVFEANSGKKLDDFFQQWLFTNENPVIKIKWKNIKKEGKVAITVEQLQNRLFEFPLDINLISGLGKNKAEKLLITKKTETFYFPVKYGILKVEIDYNTSVLADIVTTQIQ
ncbi:MAG: M1 family metallopeptidase [Bacteroidetes bacterium]|nr:M1 family metallopeptidase [Bacteroidota bacterium]